MRAFLEKVWAYPSIRFTLRTLYYFLILVGLLWIYGFAQVTSSTFIYNEF